MKYHFATKEVREALAPIFHHDLIVINKEYLVNNPDNLSSYEMITCFPKNVKQLEEECGDIDLESFDQADIEEGGDLCIRTYDSDYIIRALTADGIQLRNDLIKAIQAQTELNIDQGKTVEEIEKEISRSKDFEERKELLKEKRNGNVITTKWKIF